MCLPSGYMSGGKSDSNNVASRQQAITVTYDKLLSAAEVCVCVCVCVCVIK